MIALAIIGCCVLAIFVVFPITGVIGRLLGGGHVDKYDFIPFNEDWLTCVLLGMVFWIIAGTIVGFAIFAQYEWGG